MLVLSWHADHVSLVCDRNYSQVPASATAQPELRQKPALASTKCRGCAWELIHVISRLHQSEELVPWHGSPRGGRWHPVAHLPKAIPLPSSSTGSQAGNLCLEQEFGYRRTGAAILFCGYLVHVAVLDLISRLYSRGWKNRHNFSSWARSWSDTEWRGTIDAAEAVGTISATAADDVSKR